MIARKKLAPASEQKMRGGQNEATSGPGGRLRTGTSALQDWHTGIYQSWRRQFVMSLSISLKATGVTMGEARLRIQLRGIVQGVGFRPFVHRLAEERQLGGWVLNSSAGLVTEVEGAAPRSKVLSRPCGRR